jgi:quercetin dioxygenase-like cupin family protein
MLRTLAMLTGALGAGAWPASAEEPAPPNGGPRVAKLFSRELDTHPGESLTLVSLTFQPGVQSKPHRHPGPVLVYVLEGALEMQIGDGPLTTVREGETFYEPSGVVHSVARNPHATQPARAIAFLLGKSDAPLAKPA